MSTQPNDGEDQELIDAYQFSHNPFAARVPGFKFYPNRRKPVLAQLHQLTQHNPLMLVVTGPSGSGKSLMRQALVASSNKQSVTCVAASGKQMPDSAILLSHFSRVLGGNSQDCDGLLGQIARLANEGQSVYLLVDDADALSNEALQSLADLAAGDRDGRAHVFLFADARINKRLEELGLEDHCHLVPLQPYSLAETTEYLAIRVEGAGRDLKDVFDEEYIEHIHEESGGWPGQINNVAMQSLLEGIHDEPEPKPGVGLKQLPRKHVLAVGAILVALAGLFAFKGLFSKSATDANKPAETSVAAPVVPGVAPVTAGNVAPNERVTSLPLNAQNQPAPTVQDSTFNQPILPMGATPLPANQAVPPMSSMAPPAVAPTPKQPVTPPRPPVTQTPPVQPVQHAPVTPPPPRPTAQAPKPVPPPAPQPAMASRPLTPAPVAQRPSALAPPPAPAMTSAAGSAGQGAWYLGQPVSNYTLQLLGTSSEATARQYASQGADYHYFRKMHNGQPLYVVTYGRFSSAEAAKAAVQRLPSAMQSGNPWARPFSSIQQEVRQAGR